MTGSLFRRFRRITSSGAFIPEIDGLRFVAISAVVMYHLSGYVVARGGPFRGDASQSLAARTFEHGHYGVELFFVISGFILALPFASHALRDTKAVSLRKYFLRRLTRLEPPYVLSMLLFFAMLVVYVHQSAASLAPRLGASLLYSHSLIYGEYSAINPVAWSLEVEIQFYILVPLLAQLFAIRSTVLRRAVIVGLIATAQVCQAFLIPEASRVSLSVLNFMHFFLFGFLLADVYLVDWRSAPAPSHRWDAVSLAGWPLLPLLWTSESISRWVFPPITFILYCAAFRGAWSRKVFSMPLITTIGGMCYTIYLLHYQIISFIGRYTVSRPVSTSFGVELLWQLAILGPVILLVCAIYFVMIEKPCMRPDWPGRLAKWLQARRSGTPADVANQDS